MIHSILDNDLYKFSMMNAVLKLYPDAKVSYKFYNRGKTKFPTGFAARLRDKIKDMEKLALIKAERTFLERKTSKYFDPSYLDFLEGYRFDSKEIGIIQTGDKIEVQIEGLWYRTILWEVPILALISSTYYEMTGERIDDDEVITKRNQAKAAKVRNLGVSLAELGTRRRYSFESQFNAIKALKDYAGKGFVGTSNVYIAYLLDINIVGTQAHEWFMFHSVFSGIKSANISALNAWKRVYKGYLGTALTDTFTTDDFFRVFSKEYAELFAGVRHDSGDAITFAKKVIAHYESLDINPKTKTIIFSDGLNMEKIEEIAKFCEGKILHSFGVGTFFSNDVGVKAMSIVIKLDTVTINGIRQSCVKISDSLGKHTGNKDMIKLMLLMLNLHSHLKAYENENGNIEINYKSI